MLELVDGFYVYTGPLADPEVNIARIAKLRSIT